MAAGQFWTPPMMDAPAAESGTELLNLFANKSPARIPETQLRAITIKQLDTIMEAIAEHADPYGYLPGWTDRHGKTTHRDSISLCARKYLS